MLHYLHQLFQALDFSSLWDAVLRLAAVFLCLTVHETCHGLAALALGTDPGFFIGWNAFVAGWFAILAGLALVGFGLGAGLGKLMRKRRS